MCNTLTKLTLVNYVILYKAQKKLSFMPPYIEQGSAIAEKPVQCAASWQTCCKQIRWMLNVVNFRLN